MWQQLLDALQKTNSNNFVKSQKASLAQQHNSAPNLYPPNTWDVYEYDFTLSSVEVLFPQHSPSTDVMSLLSSMQQNTIFPGSLKALHSAWKSHVNLSVQYLGWHLLPFGDNINPLISDFHTARSPPGFWTGHGQRAHINTYITKYTHIRVRLSGLSINGA